MRHAILFQVKAAVKIYNSEKHGDVRVALCMGKVGGGGEETHDGIYQEWGDNRTKC